MLIDCDSCTARPRACGDCIVTHLLQVGPVHGRPEDSWTDSWDPVEDDRDHGGGTEPTPTELTLSEVAAVAVLSAGGLVPPLRLVTAPAGGAASGPAAAAAQENREDRCEERREARRGGRRSGTRAG